MILFITQNYHTHYVEVSYIFNSNENIAIVENVYKYTWNLICDA